MPPSSDGVRQQRFRPPPGATEILLVRHGESAPAERGAPFPLVDGHGDPPLHPDGREQAHLIADRLAGEDLAALYVTTLRRTAETAGPLADRLGLRPVVEPDLREVFLGEWEGGLLRHKVAEGDPIAARVIDEERWDAIPGAEPAADFAARVRAGLLRVAASHPDRVVAVFTHGGVIGEILRQATQSRPFAFTGADNASISHLVVAGSRWILRCYNDTTHLGPRFAAAPQPPT